MPQHYFKRINRLIIIYRVVQTVLIALLVLMAVNFQKIFMLKGRSDQFVTGIIAAIVIQLILLYPSYRLAWRDAGVEVDSSVPGISPDELMALRKKRLLGDLWKLCAIGFFIVFAILAPDSSKGSGAPLVLCATIFSFLLVCLTYCQCFNYTLKKRMKS